MPPQASGSGGLVVRRGGRVMTSQTRENSISRPFTPPMGPNATGVVSGPQNGMWRVDSQGGETTWHPTMADALAEEQRRIDEVVAARGHMTKHLPVSGIVVWFDVQAVA